MLQPLKDLIDKIEHLGNDCYQYLSAYGFYFFILLGLLLSPHLLCLLDSLVNVIYYIVMFFYHVLRLLFKPKPKSLIIIKDNQYWKITLTTDNQVINLDTLTPEPPPQIQKGGNKPNDKDKKDS